jgi:trehalose 6-phosphate phosphatase
VTYLFSRTSQDLLERFARSNVLLAFDYDGTLAPLADSPERAFLRWSTRRLLKHACTLYPSLVISGRARRDVSRRLRGIGVGQVVGNHGAEPSPGDREVRRQVRRWLPVLQTHLSRRHGVVIENKAFSIAIHYRRARDKRAARRAILAVARSLTDARIVGGKLVVNLLVTDSANKGLALERERRRFACDRVIYIGDDETDEDAFALDRAGCLLAIRVGRKRSSTARFYIHDQRDIDRLLRTLVALRGRIDGAAR